MQRTQSTGRVHRPLKKGDGDLPGGVSKTQSTAEAVLCAFTHRAKLALKIGDLSPIYTFCPPIHIQTPKYPRIFLKSLDKPFCL